jgi:hypothetical protein
MAIVKLLKVDVQYHFVAINGEDIAETISNPITIAAGDWASFSNGSSQVAVQQYITEVENQLAGECYCVSVDSCRTRTRTRTYS